MSDIQIFDHSLFGEIRILELNGKPFAVGVDVARALDYSNPSKTVIDHCKGITKLGIPSHGGVQDTNIIPEGDIYRLIVKASDQSKNPEIKAKAEKFERWIFDEILPSLRKNGTYVITDQFQVPTNYIEALEAHLRSEKEKAILQAQVQVMLPKAEMFDVIASADNTQPMSAVSKSFGIGRNKMFEFLRDQKVLRYNNEPYQAYIDRGYFTVRQVPIARSSGYVDNKTQTLVTAKGIDYIGRLLRDHGMLQTRAVAVSM